MPMYEYRCGSCGHQFEKYSAGRDGQGEAEPCPRCSKVGAKKIFSTFASAGVGSGGTVQGSSGGCGGGSGHFS